MYIVNYYDNLNGTSTFLNSYQDDTTVKDISEFNVSHDDYMFLWWTDEDGNAYKAGDSLPTDAGSTNFIINLYANWEYVRVYEECIVTFFDDKGDAVDCQPVYVPTIINTPTSTSIKSKIIVQWKDTSKGVIVKPGESITIDESGELNFYPVFGEPSVTIKDSGKWNDGVVFVKIDSEWKNGVYWVKQDGKWKQGV